MGGIASAIIIPPSGSGLDRIAPGFRGQEALRQVSAVQEIAPRREGAPRRQAAFDPDDSARSRGRDNREVRQLAIRPAAWDSAESSSSRALAIVPGAPEPGVPEPGVPGSGVANLGTDRAGLRKFGGAPFASIQFLAQMIGQSEESPSGPLAYHPDGVALGNDAYRRAGAAPPHYPEQPTVFRVAI